MATLEDGAYGVPYAEQHRAGGWVAKVYRRDLAKSSGYARVSARGRAKRDALSALDARVEGGGASRLDSPLDAVAARYFAARDLDETLSPATVTRHRDRYENHLTGPLGIRRVQDIDRLLVSETLARVAAKLSRPTRHRPAAPIDAGPVAKTLGLILTHARREGLVDTVVSRGALIPSRKKVDPHPLPPDVLDRVENAFRQRAVAMERLDRNPLLLLDAFTVLAAKGVRIGELLALRANSYEGGGVLSMDATMTVIRTPAGGESYAWRAQTKTAAGTRRLTLPQSGTTAGALYAWEVVERRAAASASPESPLLPARNGTFLSPANLRRRWREALDAFDPELMPARTHTPSVTPSQRILYGLRLRITDTLRASSGRGSNSVIGQWSRCGATLTRPQSS